MSTLDQLSLENLPSQYDHAAAQARWYNHWIAQGYFSPKPDPTKKPYTIVIPPPNVTGALHLGHALNNTLQDIMVRLKRMQGFNTLWVPGTDHAGIATQAVVERGLMENEKLSRHDLGREKLVERIWEWKEQYEKRITGQLKQMGISCDWSRQRFTLDTTCARAVRETFYHLFKEGKIYRGKRLVNWDTFLETAVSDDEVNHKSIKGHFWHFKYAVLAPQPGEPTHVTIATTRPETMLGDTAVAIHPDPAHALEKHETSLREKLAEATEKEKPAIQSQLDALQIRRQEILPGLKTLCKMAAAGRQLMLPLVNRPIPIVTDRWAKPELGSGCVKITPAHDPNDYEVGLRQGLEMINIMNRDGTLNENGGPYVGLTMKKARTQVVESLEDLGLMVEIEDREIELGHSDRSKTPIEPYLADQWFVKMDQLAQTAMDAVEEKRVKIIPNRYTKGYLDWLSEKRDWPIGRQLWWGHQIPIWYAPTPTEAELKKAFANRQDVTWIRDTEREQWLISAQQEDLPSDIIPGHTITREEDVLDTWFSSALWPHSTLGWPQENDDLRYFYPTSTLITSRDIITLWVARMVLFGLYNMNEVPFKEVYIHPKILDGFGETMSKSKGNGVDPLDVIEKFGADALRFGIAYITTETQDVRMPVDFECPHCQATLKQTKKNRVQTVVQCKECKESFSTQWATTPADLAFPRGAVTSERFELGRNFCNKLWNASRFALMNLQGYAPGEVLAADLTTEDRWLLSRLSTLTQEVSTALETYRFADASRALYDFAWDEFCSFYVEISKSRFSNPAQRVTVQRVTAYALDTLLRLLHPMIPFLTEEVWQLLAKIAPVRGLKNPTAATESICIAPWPSPVAADLNLSIEQQFAQFQAVIGAVREIRSRQGIAPKETVLFSVTCSPEMVSLLAPMKPYFSSMANAEITGWGPEVIPPETVASISLAEAEVHVDIEAFIDVEAEIARLDKQHQNLSKHITSLSAKLSNENFTSRAPAEVVAEQRQTLETSKEQILVIEAALEKLKNK